TASHRPRAVAPTGLPRIVEPPRRLPAVAPVPIGDTQHAADSISIPRPRLAEEEAPSYARPAAAGITVEPVDVSRRVSPPDIPTIAPPAPENARDAAAEPASTIHVSIGRIEVRAVPAPAQPPRRPTCPAPRLSL